jgi:hypothetical protein
MVWNANGEVIFRDLEQGRVEQCLCQ